MNMYLENFPQTSAFRFGRQTWKEKYGKRSDRLREIVEETLSQEEKAQYRRSYISSQRKLWKFFFWSQEGRILKTYLAQNFLWKKVKVMWRRAGHHRRKNLFSI
jgi:hypothetical protein